MVVPAIARDLNRRGIIVNKRQWTNVDIRNIITNPKYAGWNVWHRGTQRLRGKRRPVASGSWITKCGAFTPIIDQETFDRVQAALPRHADAVWTDGEIVDRLKRLLKAKGRLSESLILSARGMPATSTLHRHLGSYKQIYEKVGFNFVEEDIFRGRQMERTMQLRRKIVQQIVQLFPGKVIASHLPERSRSILQLENGVTVALLLCRIRQSKGREASMGGRAMSGRVRIGYSTVSDEPGSRLRSGLSCIPAHQRQGPSVQEG